MKISIKAEDSNEGFPVNIEILNIEGWDNPNFVHLKVDERYIDVSVDELYLAILAFKKLKDTQYEIN